MANKNLIVGDSTVLIIKNPAVVEANSDTVWTTGLEAAGGATATGTTTLVTNPKILKKAFELRLFKTNEFITLLPGEVVRIHPANSDALAYYLSIPDGELFKIVNRSSFEMEVLIPVKIAGSSVQVTATTAGFTPAQDAKWVWTLNGVVDATKQTSAPTFATLAKDDVVTATVEGITGTMTVIGNTTVTGEGGSQTLTTDLQLTATLNPTKEGVTFTWSSADTTKATVDQTGKATKVAGAAAQSKVLIYAAPSDKGYAMGELELTIGS